jgi:hypothetical protein
MAATEMPPSPEPGFDVMYGAAPALPEADATRMPACAAFVTASASASSAVPKSAPNDMLMTSMSFATAQSMASTTRSVEPVQPKTRTAYSSALGATPGPI